MRGPRDGCPIVRAEIHGAKDAANGVLVRRSGFVTGVAAGPDGAVGGVEELGGDGAHEELVEGVAVGRKHDEIGALAVGGFHDGRGRIAIEKLGANREAFEIGLKNGVAALAGGFLDFVEHVPAGGDAADGGNSRGAAAVRDDMNGDDFGMEMAGERGGLVDYGKSGVGEINGEKDFSETEHRAPGENKIARGVGWCPNFDLPNQVSTIVGRGLVHIPRVVLNVNRCAHRGNRKSGSRVPALQIRTI